MILKINILTREIEPLPEGFVLVQNDNNSQVISFSIPKDLGGVMVDQSKTIKVIHSSGLGTKGADITKNIKEEGDNLTFDWEIKNTLTATVGVGKFSVNISDDTGFSWTTKTQEVMIAEGLTPPLPDLII